jgi:hypothetical protein
VHLAGPSSKHHLLKSTVVWFHGVGVVEAIGGKDFQLPISWGRFDAGKMRKRVADFPGGIGYIGPGLAAKALSAVPCRPSGCLLWWVDEDLRVPELIDVAPTRDQNCRRREEESFFCQD